MCKFRLFSRISLGPDCSRWGTYCISF
jgi:hypothetical protein